MCHYFFSYLLKPIMLMEELPFKSICQILWSIWSKTFLPWRNFMWCVYNPSSDKPRKVKILTMSWKVGNPIETSSSGSESLYYLNKCVYNCHRFHTQLYFWICDKLWWDCANGQPSDESFLIYAASMRQLWLYQWKTYNCTLEKPHQMKVHRMSSVKKYIYFSQFFLSLD